MGLWGSNRLQRRPARYSQKTCHTLEVVCPYTCSHLRDKQLATGQFFGFCPGSKVWECFLWNTRCDMWSFCQSLTWDAFVVSASWILQHQCPAKKHQQKTFEAFKQGSPWTTMDHHRSHGQYPMVRFALFFFVRSGDWLLRSLLWTPWNWKILGSTGYRLWGEVCTCRLGTYFKSGVIQRYNKETLKDSPQVGINSEYWVLNMIVYYIYIYWLITGVFCIESWVACVTVSPSRWVVP